MATRKSTPKKLGVRKVSVKKSEPVSDVFNITFTVNGEVTKAQATDLAQAISDFKPDVIKGKTLIAVEKNGKKTEKLLFVPQARRVFGNSLTAKFLAKNIEQVLK